MTRIAQETRAGGPRAVGVPPRSRRVLWLTVWAAIMAAGLAAVAVGLSVSSRDEKLLATLADESSALRVEIDRERRIIEILRDPATQIVALAGLPPAPSARARMIWNERVGGLLVTAGLPVPPTGKTYQLWAIVGKNPPVSAGVFTVDSAGTGSVRVSPLSGVAKVDTFAVTLEPAGGLAAPSGPMFLAGRS